MLTIRNLSKSFGGIRAVRDISLALGEGELRCLIGPNGAGKSTLFRLIMGLERPDFGSVALNGKDIAHLQPFQRVRLGLSMKYQTTRVFGTLTVEQNIMVASTGGAKGEELVALGPRGARPECSAKRTGEHPELWPAALARTLHGPRHRPPRDPDGRADRRHDPGGDRRDRPILSVRSARAVSPPWSSSSMT